MKELSEIRFDDQKLVLKDNLVKGTIIPKNTSEVERDISIQGETVIEGAVYARNIEINKGPLSIEGAVFTMCELHVFSDVQEPVMFNKCVGSAGSIVAHSLVKKTYFGADINAKTVNLHNSYVASNIFADEIILENCVVLGGVFATKKLTITNAVVGTFNSPSVNLGQEIHLLLPSAFSVEPLSCLPGTHVINHTLADLGDLMLGLPEKEKTGSIPLDPSKEEQRTVLVDDAGNTQVLRSISVVGKVLAADLLDLNKLQNHFLLTAGSLGSQLLKTYEIGTDAKGNKIELTSFTLSDFFFKILDGRISPRHLDNSFSMSELVEAYKN